MIICLADTDAVYGEKEHQWGPTTFAFISRDEELTDDSVRLPTASFMLILNTGINFIRSSDTTYFINERFQSHFSLSTWKKAGSLCESSFYCFSKPVVSAIIFEALEQQHLALLFIIYVCGL